MSINHSLWSLNLLLREEKGATGQAAWHYQFVLGRIPFPLRFNLLSRVSICSICSVQRCRVVAVYTHVGPRSFPLPAHNCRSTAKEHPLCDPATLFAGSYTQIIVSALGGVSSDC